MSLTKLSLTGNNLIIPGQGEFGSDIPAWGRENRYPYIYSVGMKKISDMEETPFTPSLQYFPAYP